MQTTTTLKVRVCATLGAAPDGAGRTPPVATLTRGWPRVERERMEPRLRLLLFARARLRYYLTRFWPRVNATTLDTSTSVGQIPAGEPCAMIPASRAA